MGNTGSDAGVNAPRQPRNQATDMTLNTMRDFDLTKFMGTWYEIAHTQDDKRGECSNARIVYTRCETNVTVRNECFNKDGLLLSVSEGYLGMPNENAKSKLVVNIVKWTNKLTKEVKNIKVLYDFWVVYADYEKYALIGNPHGYFWLLSRQSHISLCAYNSFMTIVNALGLRLGNFCINTNVLVSCTDDDKRLDTDVKGKVLGKAK